MRPIRRFLPRYSTEPLVWQLNIFRVAAVVAVLAAWPLCSRAQFDSSGSDTATSGANGQATPSATSTGDVIGVPSPGPIVPGTGIARPLPTPPLKPVKTRGKYDITRIGERGIGGGMNLYSLERERALGMQLSQQVESSSRLISDKVVTEYVNRIGQTIVRNSDARVPFTIKVIDDDEINAFALPGGYFYVNTGLILAAENEAELAGVMAHEIAHVAARHATKNATRAEIFNIASIPLIFMGGPAGYAIRQVAGIAVPMSFLKFSRDAEREADLLGLEYEYASGYDPAEFVHFFETLRAHDKEKHNVIVKAFATHPMTDDRIKRAQKEIESMLPPRPEYIVNTSEFDQIKGRLAAEEDHLHLDATGNIRPTLRRRGPADDDTSNKDGGRPTLKRRPN